MVFWQGELRELDKLYESFRGHLPDIVKEMEQLVKTEDPNVVMLYSRRCLEVIITDLCETELGRPRKTEPLKGIIDKLNSEEKVPSHIIASMQSLNTMANYGAHPKDFDPEQVKPVLNNLAIIIKWYLKFRDFNIVSKTDTKETRIEIKEEPAPPGKKEKPVKKSFKFIYILLAVVAVSIIFILIRNSKKDETILQVAVSYREGVKYEAFTDPRDNKVYKTVQIGNQVWMADNLNATVFNDGSAIPLVKNDKEWEKLKTPAFCWYENDEDKYGLIYGPLYNWYAVNTGKLCPDGWHVPADTEWTALIRFMGDSIFLEKEVAAIRLKESGTGHWEVNDTIHSNNESGFTALPGGERTVYGLYYDIGRQGCWWSSTEDDYNKGDGKNIEMSFSGNNVTTIEQYKQFGMSVRCVKNK